MKTTFLTIIFSAFAAVMSVAQPFVNLDTKHEHSSGVESIVVSPDGRTMVTGDDSGFMIFWELPSMTVIQKIKAHGDCVNSILFNKAGTRIVTTGDDGKVRLWSVDKRVLINTYSAPFDRVNFGVLSPDGKYIYFGGYRRSDVQQRTFSERFTGLFRVPVYEPAAVETMYDGGSSSTQLHGITDGNLDATGKYVVFSAGFMLYFWNISENRMSYKLPSRYNLNNLTPDYNVIYTWGDGHLSRWTSGERWTESKDVVAGKTGYESGYSKMVLSKSKTMLVTGDDGTRVNIWNAKTLTKTQVLTGHSRSVITFAFFNNDSMLVTGSYDGTLKIWGFAKPVEEEKDTANTAAAEKITASDPVIKKDTSKVVVVEEKPKDVVFSENNIPLTVRDRVVEKVGDFAVKTEEFEIEIWDNSVVDGDIISLNINGDWILENYTVTKEKKSLKIKVKPNTNNYLILYAHNLGEISPNTAAVGLLIDGKIKRLTVSSDLKKCGALNFEYKP